MWYNNRVAAKKATVTNEELEKRLKKLKKVLKNLLTKRNGCDIIDRLSRKRAATLAKASSSSREGEWRLNLDN